MKLKHLIFYLIPVVTTILLSLLLGESAACGSAGSPDLDDLDDIEVPVPPYPMMNPLTALAAIPAIFLSVAASFVQSASMFGVAATRLKKQKKMEKKAAKKMYKKGMGTLMSRLFSGQLPQPQDLISSRNSYSTFFIPQEEGVLDIPRAIPGPDDLSIPDYARIFRQLNG